KWCRSPLARDSGIGVWRRARAFVTMRAFSMPRRGISRGYLLAFLVVAGAYLGAGKGGIELSVARFVITPVWAPSGIAVAALLLGGMRLWPAVTLGAFLANVTSGTGAPIALGIAV